MSRPRPAMIFVLGILNIVFGLIALTCTGLEGLFFYKPDILGETPMKPEFMAHLQAEIPGYSSFAGGYYAARALLSFLLIAAGVGLLAVQRWGRWLGLIYSVTTIALQAGNAFFQIQFVNPVTVRYFQQPQFLDQHNLESVIFAILGGVYALVLGVLLCLPRARASFNVEPRQVT